MTNDLYLYRQPTLHLVPHQQFIKAIAELTKAEPTDIHDKIYNLAKFIENQNASTFKQLDVKEDSLPIFELCLENITLCELHKLGQLSGTEDENVPLHSVKIVHCNSQPANIGYKQGYAHN